MTSLTILASDGSSDVHTITREEWEIERAKSDVVHVVRAERTGRCRRVKRPMKYHNACAEVHYRSGGLCEANITGACPDGPHRADHHHHVVLRSRGGADEASNLLHVCNTAHTWIHHNPADATARGFMRSRGAA